MSTHLPEQFVALVNRVAARQLVIESLLIDLGSRLSTAEIKAWQDSMLADIGGGDATDMPEPRRLSRQAVLDLAGAMMVRATK